MKFEPLKSTPRLRSSCWTSVFAGRPGAGVLGLADRHDRPRRGAADRHPVRRRRRSSMPRSDPRAEPLAFRVERRVRRLVEPVENGLRGGKRQRLAAVRPGEEDVLEPVHELGASRRAPRSACRCRAPCRSGEVGLHAVTLLRAARREAEAGDDLVEDQHRAGGTRALDDAARGSRAPALRRRTARGSRRRRRRGRARARRRASRGR